MAGAVEDLEAADLAFTREETAQLLAEEFGDTGLELAERVHAATGGWPVAVRLVCETVRRTAAHDAASVLDPAGDVGGTLVAYLAERSDIPLNRRHVIGHDEVPGPNLTYQAGMHWDPGTFFNWSRLMRLAGAKKTPARGVPEVGDAVVIKPDYDTNEPRVSSCDTSTPCVCCSTGTT